MTDEELDMQREAELDMLHDLQKLAEEAGFETIEELQQAQQEALDDMEGLYQ